MSNGTTTRDGPQDNARIVLIDLTDAGRALADKSMPIAMHFEDALVAVSITQ